MPFSGMKNVDLSSDMMNAFIWLCICVCGLIAVWLGKRKK